MRNRSRQPLFCYLGNCTSARPIAISKVENSEHLGHVLLLTWNSVDEFNLIISIWKQSPSRRSTPTCPAVSITPDPSRTESSTKDSSVFPPHPVPSNSATDRKDKNLTERSVVSTNPASLKNVRSIFFKCRRGYPTASMTNGRRAVDQSKVSTTNVFHQQDATHNAIDDHRNAPRN